MPTIYQPNRNASWKITMYLGDHQPPHFHIVASNRDEALVEIAGLTVIAGSVRSNILKAAIAWAHANKMLLAAKWVELHRP